MDKFRPERWLDEGGRVRSVPEFIPFGIGKSLFSYTRCHPHVTSPFGPLVVYIYRCDTDRIREGNRDRCKSVNLAKTVFI